MALRKLQIVFGACGATLIVSALWAQQATGQATPSPRDMATVNYTGYWVSVITEDWRFRMLTAPKGNTIHLTILMAAEMSRSGER